MRECPFCGVTTDVPHESQQGCIAALHNEIGRVRNILSALKPTHVPTSDAEAEDTARAKIRLAIEA